MIKIVSFEGLIFGATVLGLLVTLATGRSAGSQNAYVAVLGMVILVLLFSGYLLLRQVH